MFRPKGPACQMHFPGFLARKFAREVPTFGRWKNQAARAGAHQDGAREMRAG